MSEIHGKLKVMAKRFAKNMKEDGKQVKLHECLEILAKTLGFKDWNILCALSKIQPETIKGLLENLGPEWKKRKNETQ